MPKLGLKCMLFVALIVAMLYASVALAQIVDLEANRGFYSTKITVNRGGEQEIVILVRGYDSINVTVSPTRDPVGLTVKDPQDRIIRRDFIPVKTTVAVSTETKGTWKIIIQYPESSATALYQDVYIEILGRYAPSPAPAPSPSPQPTVAVPWELIGIIGGGVVAVAVVAVALLALRRKPVPTPAAPPQPPPPAPPVPAQAPSARAEETVVIEKAPTYKETEMILATFELPDGRILPVTSPRQVFGRADFERYVSADMLKYVSRRHFMISLEPGGFFIEDLGSANGTIVNGSDIRGKGKVPLKAGDVVEVGGVIKLRFKSGS